MHFSQILLAKPRTIDNSRQQPLTQDEESPLQKRDSKCKTGNLLDEDAQSIALCYTHNSQTCHETEELEESISPSNNYTQSTYSWTYGSMKFVIKQRTRETCELLEAVNHSGITYIYEE